MHFRVSAILLVPVVAGLLVSCSKTPEELVAKHSGRGDKYVSEAKFKEAVIEYKNAAKSAPRNAELHWKLANAALEAKDLRTGFQELQKTIELDPANQDALAKLGEIYLGGGKLAEASAIADNLVANRPKDPKGYILKAGIASRSGKVDESIGHLKKAVDLDPKQSRPMLIIGNLYFLKRDRKSALEWYDRALAADANAPEVRLTRGRFFFAGGDLEEGEKEYRKAIELSTDKELLRIGLAEQYLYQGRMDDSEKELNAVIKEMNSQKARKVLAELKLEIGQIAEARKIVDAILDENKKDIDGKYLKGRIALAEKRLDDAKGLFGEVLKQDAGMARAHLYNGVTEIAQGHIDIGKKEVAEAVRLNPDDVRARLVLADLYLKSNAPAEAEKEASEALRRNPSIPAATALYGDSFLLRKDWKKAEQVYQSMIRQSPKNPAGYLKMGFSKMLQEKPGEAAAYFAQAVERNPKDIGATNEYLFALAASGRKDQAAKVVQEALAKDPKNPLAWEMAGRFRVASRQPAEAEAAFLKAIDLAPGFTQPYYALGVLYASQKKLPEAEAKLLKVVEKNDRNVGAHAMLGLVLQMEGRIDEANKRYRRVLDLEPKNALAANNLAANLSDRNGNLDEALKFAQVAREAVPEDPNVGDTLGWIYYRKGLFDTAYPLIADAARKLARNPAVRYHHGMVLAKKGKTKEAAGELKAALSIDGKFFGSDEARKTLASLQ